MINFGMQQASAGERPLITFALFAYNQEKYIREAVESALLQTYKPLEIILSDDSSTDQTYEIIQEISDKYNGSHKIVINRNEKNMGISSHVRKIHEMSKGRIVIHAAGDDISSPERALHIFNAFEKTSNTPSMVVSNAIKIDKYRRGLGLLSIGHDAIIRDNNRCPLRVKVPINGCTIAISRKLIEKFPAPIDGLIAEDILLQRRASLLDGITYIPDALVEYRIHEDAITAKKNDKAHELKRLQIWHKDRLSRLEQFKIDANHIDHQLSKEDEAIFSRDKTSIELGWNILDGGIMLGVWMLAKSFFYELVIGGSVSYFKDRMRLFLLKWF